MRAPLPIPSSPRGELLKRLGRLSNNETGCAAASMPRYIHGSPRAVRTFCFSCAYLPLRCLSAPSRQPAFWLLPVTRVTPHACLCYCDYALSRHLIAYARRLWPSAYNISLPLPFVKTDRRCCTRQRLCSTMYIIPLLPRYRAHTPVRLRRLNTACLSAAAPPMPIDIILPGCFRAGTPAMLWRKKNKRLASCRFARRDVYHAVHNVLNVPRTRFLPTPVLMNNARWQA